MTHIYTVGNKKEEKFLRKKTEPYRDFHNREATRILVETMRKAMRAANGVGLSANQIGINLRVFVAEVPSEREGSKFYAIFNPELKKISEEAISLEEGCLSVPGMYGEIARADRLVLSGFDKNGKPLKIKAWGFLARVFQHEVDHLNGRLFIDKAKNLHKAPTSERLKEREEKIREA